MTRSRWRERQGCREANLADGVRGTRGDRERERSRRVERLWQAALRPGAQEGILMQQVLLV